MTARSLLKVAYVAVWFTGSGMERLEFDPPPTPRDQCGYKEANTDHSISLKSGLRSRVVHRVRDGEVGIRPQPPHPRSRDQCGYKEVTLTTRSLLKVV